MSGFIKGDCVRIKTDRIEGVPRARLHDATGIVSSATELDVKVFLTSGAEPYFLGSDWWFTPDNLELIGPTDEEVAKAIERTVELERSLHGATTAHAERESRESGTQTQS